MAVITAISVQKRNKSRVNLYVDGAFLCGMQLETVVEKGLKAGAVVDEKQLAEIAAESEKRAALERALGYVSRVKSRRQVRDYLREKGFGGEAADYAIGMLESYRYLDDAAYAKTYVEQYSPSKGKNLLRQELLRRGIPADDADAALAEISDESAACRQAADKYLRNKAVDGKILAKLGNYLYQKGFDWDTIRTVFAKFKEE